MTRNENALQKPWWLEILTMIFALFVLAIGPSPGGVAAQGISMVDVGPRTGTFTSSDPGHSASGRVLSLAVAADGRRLYAGTLAGVWRSDDEGRNWRQMTRPQPPQGSTDVPGALPVPNVYDIIVSPVDNNLVFVAVNGDSRAAPKDGIYRSVDGGETWEMVHQFHCGGSTTATPVGQLTFAPDDARQVYAAGGCVVALSTNGGARDSWIEVPIADADSRRLGSVWHLAVAARTAVRGTSIRMVYGVGPGEMWYSSNGGNSWLRDQGLMPANCPSMRGQGIAGDRASDNQGNGERILAIEPGRPDQVFLVVPGVTNGRSYFHPQSAGPEGIYCNLIKFVDTNSNKQWDPGEAVISDGNSNTVYDDGEIVISGTRPPPGTLLETNAGRAGDNGPPIKYVDSGSVGDSAPVWNTGETVVLDGNDNSSYDAGEQVITGRVPIVGAPLKAMRVCGEGSLWVGDYSNFTSGGSARWTQLPGPPAYFGGSTVSGNTFLEVKATPNNGYLLFFSDRAHVHVSAGRPTATNSWYRLDGRTLAQSWRDRQWWNTLLVHADPHAIALSPSLSMSFQDPAGDVPSPYNQNKELASLTGTIWMGNDGGVSIISRAPQPPPRGDVFVTFDLGHSSGLMTLQPINIAGLAFAGRPPALFMGTGDNDDFYSTNGGNNWGDPYSACGDCDAWFGDPAQPFRALSIVPREDEGGFALYISADQNQYPEANNSNIRVRMVCPNNCNARSSYTSRGYRPIVQTLWNEQPPTGGDFIVVGNAVKDDVVRRVVFRKRDNLPIMRAAAWEPRLYQYGPDLPTSTIDVVQASGGHASTTIYASDPSSGLWKWRPGMSIWQPIVRGDATLASATQAGIAQNFFVDPYNPALIYLVDVDGIKRSDDGGNNWSRDLSLNDAVTENNAFPTDRTSGQTILKDMIFDRQERCTRFAVGDAGVFFTIDGRSWQRLLSTTALPSRPLAAYFDSVSDPRVRELYVAFGGRSVMRFGPIPSPPPQCVGGVR